MVASARLSVQIRRIVLVLLMAAAIIPAIGGIAHAAASSALTRYPYLTDSIQTSITVNWATDTSASTGTVQWGPNGSCSAHTTAATKASITVISKAEYQWKATIPVTPDTTDCYRVFLGSTDLLGSDSSPVFTSQVAAGSSTPFSFDVFGDWGQAYSNGNPDQANVLQQMSVSGARFAVMTGDTAYPGGGQNEYGDLQQAGTDQSTVFGPSFWTVPGRSLPVFNVTGNHGFTNGSNQVINWPEGNAASGSGGRYLMEQYPSINGTTATNYPSMWYAFDAGPARFYALTSAWADGNNGSATVYQNDHDQHWTVNSAEYQWLKADLEAHPNALKFAFWHYPLYADSSGQPSDTYLQGGSGTLQGLLDQNGVAIVFNGHAHGYERNKPDAAGLVSYVFGNGGAAMGSVSGCSSFDAYAIGAGGSHCGAAPSGLSLDHVYGFAKVTVNGRQVTVTPTDEMGRTFDVQTYNFPNGPADTQAPTPPTAVTATAVSTSKINISWSGATDNVGVTGYRVFRDGVQLVEQAGTSYTDATATPNTTYSYTVVALDAAGNASAPSAPATVSTSGAPDGTPPSQPANLTATAPSSSQVNLSWTASTDNVAVVGYNVYRNGVQLPNATQPDSTPPTTYTDDTASPGTAYTYQASAVDAAGNESSKASVSVTTPGGSGGSLTFAPTDDATVDASQPTVNFGTASRLTVDNSPVNYSLLKFNVTGTPGCAVSSAKLRMTVGNTTNDNSPYGGDLYSTTNGWSESSVTWNTAPAAGATKVSSVATAVALNSSYFFDVAPLITGDGTISVLIKSPNSDGARYYSKESGTSAQAPQLQIGCAGDTTPPSPPGNLTATTSSTQINLSWTAATDNVGVTGYKVFRNSSATALATLPGTATGYTDNTVKPGTSYSYQVTALDAAGNQSTRASVNVTTTTAADDFSVSASPSSLTATAGQSATSTISTAVTGGAAQSVVLTASGAPTGATVSFNPTSITSGQTSTMAIATTSSTPAGVYSIVVTATGASATHTTTVSLTVNAPVQNDFSIMASPTSVSVTAGQSGTSTISTAVTSGSAESVTLSASGQPSGVTVGFTPASVTAGNDATITMTVASGTTPGSYPITVTGTAASATHSTSVTLTVTAASSAPRLVQTAAGTETSAATSLTATFTNPTTRGNLLLVSASVYTGATNHITSVTDSAGNTWTRIGGYSVSGHNSDGEMWYAANAAPSTTVTVHTASAASVVLQVLEFAGIATSSPLDTSIGASNTSASPSSGSLTPTASNDLVVGFLAGHGNTEAMTVTTPGYTAQSQQTTTGTIVTVRTGFQVLSPTSPIGISGSFSTAMYWAAGVAAFKAAS
jgi:fibronectin type 3 domain-containing protein